MNGAKSKAAAAQGREEPRLAGRTDIRRMSAEPPVLGRADEF